MAELQTVPAKVTAGDSADLAFRIKNPSGGLVRDLQIVHEKPMHLLIVSDDLDEFYHVHPEVQADGGYTVSFTFPKGGNYKLYTDYTPLDSAQIVESFPVSVSGTERAAKELKVDKTFEKTVESLRVVMKPDGDLSAGRELMLNYYVFDAANGKPVTDLENYLGAKAHFVIISQDLQEFVHAHPMSNEGAKTEEHPNASENEHAGHDNLANSVTSSTVSAHVTFPKAAFYRIWAQFQRGGKVITVPFTVDVNAG